MMKGARIFFLFLAAVLTSPVHSSDDGGSKVGRVVYIVISQSNDYHEEQADKFKQHFHNQLSAVAMDDRPNLYFTHLDMTHIPGAWSLFPLIVQLAQMYEKEKFNWAFICEEDTRVDIARLDKLLEKYKPTENYFIGRPLKDVESTIIHHFSSPGSLSYPDTRAGYVMSSALILGLNQRLKTDKLFNDFSIDPKHELAKFVLNDGKGTSLTAADGFCSVDEGKQSDNKCVTTQGSRFPTCAETVDKHDLFVAVKTCSKFHDSRVSIVKSTWGKEAELIEYYSDIADASIPTVYLGIPNTERGHCGKTMAIIHRITKDTELNSLKWILIADDDTIINLGRLRKLLSCYNFRQPVALGERYGYFQSKNKGYDYITMGGGIVLSQPALRMLSQKCSCWADDSPDDMTLGMCLKNIGIPSTHSRFFHQARPNDYSPSFLENQVPVSFHKHWNNDPLKVYADLAKKMPEDSSSDVKEKTKSEKISHQEL